VIKRSKSDKRGVHPCPVFGCKFKSKHRFTFRAHLQSSHSFTDVYPIWCSELDMMPCEHCMFDHDDVRFQMICERLTNCYFGGICYEI